MGIVINGKDYKELRCFKCQNFVIYQSVAAGILCIRCPKCGFLNEWTFKYLKTKENEANIKRDYQIETESGGGEN